MTEPIHISKILPTVMKNIRRRMERQTESIPEPPMESTGIGAGEEIQDRKRNNGASGGK